MKEIDKLNFRPFTRFCMSIGAVPSSYLAGLTIEEQLLWLCSYLEKEVIPAVNNNAEAVEELQGLFTELHDYVEHYFDNLDVQEEINNKLDDMVEQGTLQEIIATYLDTKAIFCFDTVALMKNAENLIDGSYARTLGFYEKNDGGGAIYKIRTITNDDIINEINIFEMLNDNTLIAELIANDYIIPEQLGAKGDATTNNYDVFNYMFNNFNVINFLSNKTYKINNNIVITNEVIINGNNSTITGYGLFGENNLTINNLIFYNINENAISFQGSDILLRVKNCRFENIGVKQGLVPNYQGMAIYATENSIDVSDSTFIECNGHGCIFSIPNSNVNIYNNNFNNNFFRAISIYRNDNTKQATGKIYNNIINNSGVTNTTSSGVGCNGIFGPNAQYVEVYNNKITNSVENGIEGNFYYIHDNYIENTGIDYDNKPTPSTEGIYLLGGEYNSIVSNNTIINSRIYPIYSYSGSGKIKNKKIINNIINTTYEYAIGFNSLVATENCEIYNNITDKKIFINNGNDTNLFIGDSKKVVGYCSTILHLGITQNIVKYFNNIGDFVASNVTPTFITDSDLNITVMQLVHQQYARVESPAFALPIGGRVEVEIYAKGNFNCNLYKNNTYGQGIISTSNNSTFTVVKRSVVPTSTLGNLYKVTIEPKSGETIEVAYIIIRIFE